ncbi:HNH endonuclease [Tabrizicola sp.]|uniref:HNH endonuclease n=1 Tax=Tabrizicola sp. TaxID=2005166 RepID=UPI002628036E|nr:HNH endonuclease [Tabrizicola sp.]MDM7930527.1 HNH endonuclease [Tabrizicola sp.]
MLNADPSAFEVFSRWKDAPANAFGSKNNPGVIPAQDKARYTLIYNELMSAATAAKASLAKPDTTQIKSMNYSSEFGSRGHRPVDMWVSLCGAGSEEFARMPQIYAIASDRGVEIGFAISINEDDYHDISVKLRNRTIVPLINRKLPNPSDESTLELAEQLNVNGDWVFNSKARLSPGDDGYATWASLGEMIASIKQSGTSRGGGSICKLFQPNQVPELDLEGEFTRAIQLFYPVLMGCLPSAWESELVLAQVSVDKFGDQVAFDPTNLIDARDKVLRQIAQRRGQSKFRQSLFKAYNGTCAVSRTQVDAVLEAAHISPYLGDYTNHISNGILLRTDLHTLFDLHLMRINPNNHRVEISPSLSETPYWVYNGKKIRLPEKPDEQPSKKALEQHFSFSKQD